MTATNPAYVMHRNVIVTPERSSADSTDPSGTKANTARL